MPRMMLSSNALIWLLMLTIVQHSCLGRYTAGSGDSLTQNLNSSLSGSVNGGSADRRGTAAQDNSVHTTINDLGDIAVKIASQVHGQEVDLNSITKLLTELARSAVIVNNPKAMYTTELDEELNMLKQDVNQRIQELKQENQQMKERIRKLVQDSNNLSELPRSDGNKGGASYEFQAFANMKQTLSNKSVLKFRMVRRDEANSYNKDFGFYTCPDDGDYFISSTITPYHMDSNSYRMVAANVKQGNNGNGRILFQMSAMMMRVSSTSRWSTGSGSYITHCQKGEHIWVEGADMPASGSLLQGGPDEYGTMFHIIKMK